MLGRRCSRYLQPMIRDIWSLIQIQSWKIPLVTIFFDAGGLEMAKETNNQCLLKILPSFLPILLTSYSVTLIPICNSVWYFVFRLGSVWYIIISMSLVFAAAASKTLSPLISAFYEVICRHAGLLILVSRQLLLWSPYPSRNSLHPQHLTTSCIKFMWANFL